LRLTKPDTWLSKLLEGASCSRYQVSLWQL
jgi:hypothetical protein